MNKKSLSRAFFVLALAICAPLGANPAVVESVRAFLYAQAPAQGGEVQVEVFAPAARFPACARPRPFLPPHHPSPLIGRVSVGVRCGGESSARYLSARIAVTGSYLEAATAIAPGTRLTAKHLRQRRGDLGRLPPHALHRPEEALGKVARRGLAPGTVLQSHYLGGTPLIERGQRVSVESRGPGFVVTREGEAMENGELGERIRVRLSPRESLNAVVSGPGRASAGF